VANGMQHLAGTRRRATLILPSMLPILAIAALIAAFIALWTR
jgi:hypothetical protein